MTLRRRASFRARGWLHVAFVLGLGMAFGACGDDEPSDPPKSPTAIADLELSGALPTTWVPGTTVRITGANFAPEFAGPTWLRMSGAIAGAAFEIDLPARFIDYQTLEVDWPGAAALGYPPDGAFEGSLLVVHDKNYDGKRHTSKELPAAIAIASALTPTIAGLDNQVAFLNDRILASGDGFLLGGNEGQTTAIVTGCFTRQGEPTCQPVGPVAIDAMPVSPAERTAVSFPFGPQIAGIQPGSFTGEVAFENRHGPAANAVVLGTPPLPTANAIGLPIVGGFAPTSASLGQFVNIGGRGFIGATPGVSDPNVPVTIIALNGTFSITGAPVAQQVQLGLIPNFEGGDQLRYPLNESDELGQLADLRTVSGTMAGFAHAIVKYGDDTVEGPPTPVQVSIAPVKQVVWLDFLPSYVESLRHFGLRHADAAVRARVFEVVRRDYAGVNIELRDIEPEDFALYSEVEISGPDPNGLGLLGYDNTPGKDVGNQRLNDKIGGLNALTQLDGVPGYGGVFVESLFAYSTQPEPFAQPIAGQNPLFDQLFDPFRPDVGGSPITPDEAAVTVPLASSEGCPATNRTDRIRCAVWALGSLIGTTVSHEVAHSLGLGDPGGEGLHNMGDWPNALMDTGENRGFPERAEVGSPASVLCRAEFDYLQTILPTGAPDPLPSRPDCF